ncbi:hypothetical protein B4U80_12063 [Leptotrombidium deliense]|uniref:F-box domain-containing protein n=1 Tax=Leptotrombidium deliense TaxID=299467 RepID=A0A443RYR0_9ACAR|nr:hypothetical protein B4U80_12063 [Leptotrombidium deliense]
MEKAFGVPLITQEIFKHLEVHELINLRNVSQSVKKAVEKYIKRQNNLRITDYAKNDLELLSTLYRHVKTLFLDFELENRYIQDVVFSFAEQLLVITEFQIRCRCNNSLELFDWSLLNCLKIEVKCGEKCNEFCCTNIFENATNLTHLDVYCLCDAQVPYYQFFPSTLQSLELSFSAQQFGDLLSAEIIPKLQNLEKLSITVDSEDTIFFGDMGNQIKSLRCLKYLHLHMRAVYPSLVFQEHYFEELYLYGIKLEEHTINLGLANLKRLTLTMEVMDEEELTDLLYQCANLEYLELFLHRNHDIVLSDSFYYCDETLKKLKVFSLLDICFEIGKYEYLLFNLCDAINSAKIINIGLIPYFRNGSISICNDKMQLEFEDDIIDDENNNTYDDYFQKLFDHLKDCDAELARYDEFDINLALGTATKFGENRKGNMYCFQLNRFMY